MLLKAQDLLVMERDLYLEDKPEIETVLYQKLLDNSQQEGWDNRLGEFRADMPIETFDIELNAVVHLAEQMGRSGKLPIPPKYRVKLEEGYKYETMYMLFIHNWFLKPPYLDEELVLSDKALWKVRLETYSVEYMTETRTHKIIGLKTYQPEKTNPV